MTELDDAGLFGEWIPARNGPEILEALNKDLQENQMALLLSSGSGGHFTVAVKLEGRLYNINNQDIESEIGVAADTLQPLDEWIANYSTRASGKGNEALYQAVTSSLFVGGG